MKNTTKFLIIFLLTITTLICSNSTATVSAGYTYSHKGDAIHSTEGLTTSENPFRAADLGLIDADPSMTASDLAASYNTLSEPKDLFIFNDSRIKLTEGEDERDAQTIYLVDSKTNNLFSWDGYLTKESRKSIINYNLDILDENGKTLFSNNDLMNLKSSGEYIVRRSIMVSAMDIMAVGESQTLTALVSPIKTENNELGVSGEVTWSSSDSTVLQVTQDGVVTALTISGNSNVTITGALKDYPDVSVVISIKAVPSSDTNSLGAAKEVTSTKNSGSISENDICDSKITVIGKPKLSLQDGFNKATLAVVKEAVNSSNVFDQTFTFSSDNTSVLTINSDGEYTAVSEGMANISVVDANGNTVVCPIEVVSAETDISSVTDQTWVKEIEFKVTIKPSGLSSAFRKYNRKDNTDYIYLCDMNNRQVLVADASTLKELDAAKQTYSLDLVNFFVKPTDAAYAQYDFKPEKIVIDDKSRMYVISNGTYQGIVQLSRRGEFDRFIGVNYVTLTTWDIIWRQLSTEAQLEASNSILNTTFTSICIDETGFIYATSQALRDQNDDNIVSDSTKMIKKINHSGKDVLYRNGYQPPQGDVTYVVYSSDATVKGPSRFTSVTVNEYGVYTVADGKMGKLFTYDRNGNLLYISGGGGVNSITTSSLKTPQSISYQGENIIVLDSGNLTINIFRPTEIAVYINRAVNYQYKGELELAQNEWQNVKNLNSNYEYAYVGIGKVLYTDALNGNYTTKEKLEILQEAMENFEIGYDRNYYSRAYKIYRDYNISRFFAPVMYTVLGLVVVLIGYRTYKLIKYGRKEETGIGDE